MKKIIRLTESDLTRIVKRAVNESHDNYITCQECDGGGVGDCLECDGKGIIECPECGGYGEDRYGDICYTCDGDTTIECKNCHGTGEDECYSCQGLGKYQIYY